MKSRNNTSWHTIFKNPYKKFLIFHCSWHVSHPVMVVVRNQSMDDTLSDFPILFYSSLFFDDGRDSLLLTLLAILRPGGTALVVAPARSGTFHRFASMCRPHFRVAIVEKYDHVVDQLVQKVCSCNKKLLLIVYFIASVFIKVLY